jgi:mono/diheme cytochrome c family protein/uncharacterized membrane protein
LPQNGLHDACHTPRAMHPPALQRMQRNGNFDPTGCANRSDGFRMKRTVLVCCALTLGICRPESALGHPPGARGPRDPAADVRAIFAAKCAGCHRPDVAKPKGRFGYVLDLGRVAGNPKMVVPFKPEESKLWELVRVGEMPPPEAASGSLTDQQKEAIRAWIAAGAPPGTPPPPEDAPHPNEPSGGTAPSTAGRFLAWLGKIHLLLVHFPIALLVAAAAGELWCVAKRVRTPAPAVRFGVLLGAAAAVPAAGLGWLYAMSGHGTSAPNVLGLHRWIGTATALWAVVTAVCSELDARRGSRSWHVRILLFAAALFVGLSAHFGGILVHGEDFFDW